MRQRRLGQPWRGLDRRQMQCVYGRNPNPNPNPNPTFNPNPTPFHNEQDIDRIMAAKVAAEEELHRILGTRSDERAKLYQTSIPDIHYFLTTFSFIRSSFAVSLHVGVLPYKYRKILEMLLKLMKLCEIILLNCIINTILGGRYAGRSYCLKQLESHHTGMTLSPCPYDPITMPLWPYRHAPMTLSPCPYDPTTMPL